MTARFFDLEMIANKHKDCRKVLVTLMYQVEGLDCYYKSLDWAIDSNTGRPPKNHRNLGRQTLILGIYLTPRLLVCSPA